MPILKTGVSNCDLKLVQKMFINEINDMKLKGNKKVELKNLAFNKIWRQICVIFHGQKWMIRSQEAFYAQKVPICSLNPTHHPFRMNFIWKSTDPFEELDKILQKIASDYSLVQKPMPKLQKDSLDSHNSSCEKAHLPNSISCEGFQIIFKYFIWRLNKQLWLFGKKYEQSYDRCVKFKR